ncbi:MAG TPA: DUF434 domain-containing protein [Rectinemataceae bacterium]|nr:DUF434 domain-containing protein [Rectinemataceae bacterium]
MYQASEAVREAARDYRWLLDRGYPGAAALKLVGDRLRLSREERLVLFRGVAAAEPSRRRRALLVSSVRGEPLLVDGHNQVFTVMHYLGGRPLFLGSDGLLRDAGASHGHIADREAFGRALSLLCAAIAAARPGRVLAYFDEPITESARHAASFAAELGGLGIETDASVERSADGPVKRAPPGSAAASGDSGIAESLAARFPGLAPPESPGIFDAARFALELAFGGAEGRLPWFDLAALLDGE